MISNSHEKATKLINKINLRWSERTIKQYYEKMNGGSNREAEQNRRRGRSKNGSGGTR